MDGSPFTAMVSSVLFMYRFQLNVSRSCRPNRAFAISSTNTLGSPEQGRSLQITSSTVRTGHLFLFLLLFLFNSCYFKSSSLLLQHDSSVSLKPFGEKDCQQHIEDFHRLHQLDHPYSQASDPSMSLLGGVICGEQPVIETS